MRNIKGAHPHCRDRVDSSSSAKQEPCKDVKQSSSRVLIIVPAFNEEECISQTVNLLMRKTSFDILVVDDGSTDRTSAVLNGTIESPSTRLKRVRLPLNSGIGVAVQTGFLFADRNRYDYAVQFDGDGQHDIESLQTLVAQAISGGYELCIGSRFLSENSGFKSTALRRIGISYFSKLINALTHQTITDPTSGFRVYGKKTLRHFALLYPDDYPEPECIVFCLNHGYPVGEFSVNMHKRNGGESSIRRISSVYYVLKVTLGILFECTRTKAK